MRRWLDLVGLLLFAGLTCGFVSLADRLLAVEPPTSAPAFTGMGDTLSGAKGHWGSIAYSAATRGSNMYSICDAITAGTCKDIKTSASTGLVSSTQSVGSINPCGTGASQCYIDKAYDDSGGNNCSGVACDLVVLGGTGNRPKFLVSASGAVPGIGCPGAEYLAQTFTSINQPYSHLVSHSVPADPGTFATALGNAGVAQTGVEAGLLPFTYAGGVVAAGSAISTTTFYALIGVLNGASSAINVNGSATTGNAGTSASGTSITICGAAASNPSSGIVLEAAFYPADVTSSVAALTTDMRTNGGGF